METLYPIYYNRDMDDHRNDTSTFLRGALKSCVIHEESHPRTMTQSSVARRPTGTSTSLQLSLPGPGTRDRPRETSPVGATLEGPGMNKVPTDTSTSSGPYFSCSSSYSFRGTRRRCSGSTSTCGSSCGHSPTGLGLWTTGGTTETRRDDTVRTHLRWTEVTPSPTTVPVGRPRYRRVAQPVSPRRRELWDWTTQPPRNEVTLGNHRPLPPLDPTLTRRDGPSVSGVAPPDWNPPVSSGLVVDGRRRKPDRTGAKSGPAHSLEQLPITPVSPGDGTGPSKGLGSLSSTSRRTRAENDRTVK